MTNMVNVFPESRFVMGEGPTDAEFMFVGESPGTAEERVGRQFIGPEGRTLNKTIHVFCPFERSDVYITTVCKQHPPRNRPLKAAEIKAHLPVLIDEVERVAPKYIVTLGAPALKVFDKKAKVKQDHGQPKWCSLGEWSGWVIPWVRPAAANMNPSMFKILHSDASRLQSVLAKIDSQTMEFDYQLATENEVIREWREAGTPTLVGFDTETTSPHRGKTFCTDEAEMVGWSISWEDGKAWYVEAAEFGASMNVLLSAPHIKKVCHQAKFEYKLCKRMGITMRNMEDTKLAAYVLGENPTGLKPLARQWLGVDPIQIHEVTGGLDMSDIPAEEITDYAAADADNTLRLWKVFEPLMREREVDTVYRDIELPLIPVISRMEARGVAVDEHQCHSLMADLTDSMLQARFEACKALGQPDTFNLNAPQQLERVLLELGAPLTAKTDSGEHFSTNAVVLEELREWNPEIIDPLLKYRKYVKFIVYVKNFLLLRGPDSRLHPSCNQSGHYEEAGAEGEAPSTGRFSSSGPNLQNVPHHRATVDGVDWGEPIRACLTASEGFVLLSADLGQEEPRIVAVVAQDATLLDGFATGKDVYRPCTEALYPHTADGTPDRDWKRTWEPWERYIGKQTFLALYYGAGANRIQQMDASFSKEGAEAALEKFNTAHPARNAYLEDTWEMIWEQGYAATLYGRKRWFPAAWSKAPLNQEQALREAANSRIQGTAGDLLKLAMYTIDIACEERGLESGLLFPVHDEVVMEVKEDEVEVVTEIVRNAFMGLLDGVEMVVEVFIGKRWGEREFVPE